MASLFQRSGPRRHRAPNERIWLSAAVKRLAIVVPAFHEQPIGFVPDILSSSLMARRLSEVVGGRVGQRLGRARGRQPEVGASLLILGISP